MKNYFKFHNKRKRTNYWILIGLVVGLVVALYFVLRGTGILPSLAAVQPFVSDEIAIYPCSGKWNFPECFRVYNRTSQPKLVYYHLDCWDETKCKDEKSSVTIQPSSEVKLGLGKVCSKWQLDLNWTWPKDVVFDWNNPRWDWGGVAEAEAVCPTATPQPLSCKTPLNEFGGTTRNTITVYEKTSQISTPSFYIGDPKLKYGTVDLVTNARESYDFYVSNPDGAPNENGTAFSILMKRSVSAKDTSSGNNIDAVLLSSGGVNHYALSVASTKRGASLSSSFDGRINSVLGRPDGIVTYMGDPESRITVCFD